MFRLIDSATCETPVDVTWEQVGQQLVFADRFREIAQRVLQTVENVEKTVHQDLSVVQEFGYTHSIPLFNRNGVANYGEAGTTEPVITGHPGRRGRRL